MAPATITVANTPNKMPKRDFDGAEVGGEGTLGLIGAGEEGGARVAIIGASASGWGTGVLASTPLFLPLGVPFSDATAATISSFTEAAPLSGERGVFGLAIDLLDVSDSSSLFLSLDVCAGEEDVGGLVTESAIIPFMKTLAKLPQLSNLSEASAESARSTESEAS